jgi:tRNA dimethylallyltransferase
MRAPPADCKNGQNASKLLQWPKEGGGRRAPATNRKMRRRAAPVAAGMLPPPFANALVLAGPTGSGKTSLALELAEALSAEIVSMDSMALYRGMDIGTAKPTAAERDRVPHHVIDLLNPWESANVAWWLAQARSACQAIETRGKRTLFVGGTPLYLKALLCGIFDGPPADLAVRARLQAEAEALGVSHLHRRLAEVDPEAAVRLHANDLRRVARALEVWEVTGKPLSKWQTQWPEKDAHAHNLGEDGRILWLDLPRPELRAAIDARVVKMFRDGLVDEVRGLLSLPRPLSREARQALGYREVLDHLSGATTLEQTTTLIQAHTRQFAKRQISWFRHLSGCRPASKELTRELWKPTI